MTAPPSREHARHRPDRIFEPHRIGGCRRELLDRTLIWNQAHLRQILGQYQTHHNQHRPHRSLHGAAPLKPLPEPVDPGQCRVRRQTRVSGLIHEYRLVA
jgi:putative transposase